MEASAQEEREEQRREGKSLPPICFYSRRGKCGARKKAWIKEHSKRRGEEAIKSHLASLGKLLQALTSSLIGDL